MPWWTELDSRERLMVMIGGVAALIVIYLLAVWYPLHSSRSTLQTRVSKHQSDLIWMQTASAEIKALSGSGATRTKELGDTALYAIVGETAQKERLNNALKKVDPEGKTAARVTLEGALFDDVIRWLVKLRREYGVSVTNVNFKKGRVEGQVDAKLTLEVPTK